MTDNPFEGQAPEQTEENVNEQESTETASDDAAEFQDVEAVPADTQNTNEDVEELPATPQAPQATAPAATPKATKAPVPDGYITPVQFAHELTERERKAGRIGPGDVIAPQVIYSYVNQGKKPGAKPETSLKSYSEGGRNNLLKREEAFKYWDDKAARQAGRLAAKEAKNAAATAAAQTPAPQPEAPTAPVQEVE